MSDIQTKLKQDIALAKICLKLNQGESIDTAMTDALEWSQDDEFVLSLLDNVVAILRKLTGNSIDEVVTRLHPILETLGVNDRVNITGIEDALRFYDAPLNKSTDLENKVALYQQVGVHTFSGAFEAIKLDLARSCLSCLLAWRGISTYTQCVSEILDYLQGLDDTTIEELGKTNVNFLRKQAE